VSTVDLKQPVFANSLHKNADRACVVPTFSDSYSCNIFSSMQMPEPILLPVSAPLQKRLAQPLLAIHRRQIGDHLLLVGNAHGQGTGEAFK